MIALIKCALNVQLLNLMLNMIILGFLFLIKILIILLKNIFYFINRCVVTCDDDKCIY